jgi:hypothetical protein
MPSRHWADGAASDRHRGAAGGRDRSSDWAHSTGYGARRGATVPRGRLAAEGSRAYVGAKLVVRAVPKEVLAGPLPVAFRIGRTSRK